MVYGRYIELVDWVYESKNITGGHNLLPSPSKKIE
jgi:hypothetical protein